MKSDFNHDEFFANSGIPMCLCDTNGVILSHNRTFSAMFNRTCGCESGTTKITDLCEPGQKDVLRDAFETSKDGKAATPYFFSFDYLWKNSSKKTAEAHITRMPGSDRFLLSLQDVTDNIITLRELDRRNIDLTALVRITKLVSSTRDPHKILRVGIAEAARLFDMDMAWYLAATVDDSTFRVESKFGGVDLTQDVLSHLSRFFMENPSERLKPMLIESADGEAGSFEQMLLSQLGAKVVLLTPEILAGKPGGLLCMAALKPSAAVKSERMPFLLTLTHQLGVALENARLFRELEYSRRQYWLLSENMKDPVFTLNRELTLTYVNSAITASTGYSGNDVVGKKVTELLTDNPINTAGSNAIARIEEGEDAPAVILELRCAGSRREIADVSLAPMKEGNELVGFQGIARIITQKLYWENETKRRNEEQKLLLDLSFILSSSPELKKLHGWRNDLYSKNASLKPRENLRKMLSEAAGKIAGFFKVQDVSIYLLEKNSSLVPFARYAAEGAPPAKRKRAGEPFFAADWFRTFLGAGETVVLSNIEELPRSWRFAKTLKKSGVKSVAAAPLFFAGRPLGVLSAATYSFLREFQGYEVNLLSAIASHVSLAVMNYKYMEDIGRHKSDLERLNNRLISVQEEDRRRIARELHDEAGQSLYALRLNLDMIKGLLEKKEPEIAGKIGEQLVVIAHTIDNIRRITYDLRPMLLDDLGIIPAIRWYVDNYEKRTGIKVMLDIGISEIVLDGPAEVNIYRIIQEALTNVYRHASATTASISVAENDGRLRIKIRDDGRGFTAAGRSPSSGVGLIGMRERISSLDGSLVVYSLHGQGTTLDIEIPLHDRRQ